MGFCSKLSCSAAPSCRKGCVAVADFPLETELMLVGRVLLLLPFIGIGVDSETSEACVEEIELSSKLSLMVSDRVWRIEPPFTLSLFANPNWFVGSRLR